ncbi:MAG: FAD-dependent monooxygenase, partial [Planctomycetota bacterium]
LYGYPHSHILCYLIPGEGGELEPGSRRFNWVWYVSQSEDELRSLLTDRDGVTHRSSLGPGEMAESWADRVRERARADLPPLLADAVERTESPFVQAIFDMEAARMVHGRSVLLGDAAFLVRPHTASGASKAAADAVALAHRLAGAEGVTTEALEGWELERMVAIRQIVHLGRMIAARGGLGL